MKLGVYTDLSGHTCGNGPGTGSKGHYDIDAATFKEWQADYLKVDFCGAVGSFRGVRSCEMVLPSELYNILLLHQIALPTPVPIIKLRIVLSLSKLLYFNYPKSDKYTLNYIYF